MRRHQRLTRDNIGFLLAKALQRWNELLRRRFAEEGYGQVRPEYGSVLIPLYEEDGLPMGELARRARLSKQTITSMVREMERDGLVERRPDPADRRITRIVLTREARRFRVVAEAVLGELDRALGEHPASLPPAAMRRWLRSVADLEL